MTEQTEPSIEQADLMDRRLERFRQQTLITRLGSRPSKRSFKRASLRR